MKIPESPFFDIAKESGETSLEQLIYQNNLSKLLSSNELLRKYVKVYNLIVINSFMLGRSPGMLDYDWEIPYYIYNPDEVPDDPRDLVGFKKVEAKTISSIKAGHIPVENLSYSPITPTYIRQLIKIDEMFRLSKCWNREEQMLFKGGVAPKELKLDKLNSFTTSKTIANRTYFNKGAVLVAKLPKGFPAIDISQMTFNDSFRHEKEILLPPCEFESVAVKKDEYEKYYEMEVKLRPQSLAKVMLEKMKHPPKDYPKKFLTDPMYGYDKALKMLEEYVKNDVENHIIRVNDTIIKELPDPEVQFLYTDEDFEK